jgi:hypothetical protein
VTVQASIRIAQKERASIEIAASGRIECFLIVGDSTLKVALAQATQSDRLTVPMPSRGCQGFSGRQTRSDLKPPAEV